MSTHGPKLTHEEVGELKELFDMLDTDKGGTLSVAEIMRLLEMLGVRVSLQEARSMVAAVDTDGSGALDFEEFLQVVAAPRKLPYTRADLLRAFRRFADRGLPPGCIAPETLEKALLAHGGASGVDAAEIGRLVHTLETSRDGLINFREKASLLFSGRLQDGAQG